MQRSSCPRSAVPRGCEKQAHAPLHPRTSLAPSAQGRAGVPTESADSLLGAPALADPYLRFLCDKEFVSAKQTSTKRVRSHYGPSPLRKPCLAGLAGYVSKCLSALDRVESALPSGEERSRPIHATPLAGPSWSTCGIGRGRLWLCFGVKPPYCGLSFVS